MKNYMVKIIMVSELEICDEESFESAKKYVKNELDNITLPFDFEIEIEEA